MNSMSRDYCHDDYNHCKKEKDLCPTIIKCGCPSSTAVAAGAAGRTFTVNSLTLNTSCLCDPCTKLEFASNIIIDATFTGTLSFQVFKICNNQFQPVPVGPAWTFANPTAAGPSSAFTFFICDCDACSNDCCTYTVVATTSTATVGNATIANATLGAIATCNSNQCSNRCSNRCINNCTNNCC